MQVGQNGARGSHALNPVQGIVHAEVARMRPISQGIEQPYLHPIQSRDGRAGKAAEVA